ncbi:MAG: PDZ domain-containing protein [Pseudomonadota bacterium]
MAIATRRRAVARYAVAGALVVALSAATTLAQEASEDELLFWESIRNGGDSAEYEAYLEAFPDGKFAPLARVRIRKFGAKDTGAEQAETRAAEEQAEPEQAKAPPETETTEEEVAIDTSGWVMPPLTGPDRSVIGINISNVTKDIAERTGVAEGGGVHVANVQSISTAGPAGLMKDDVILSANGRPMAEAQSLVDLTMETEVGDTITLQIVSEGEERTIEIETVALVESHFNAAKSGNPASMAMIASLMEDGRLVERSLARARLWHKRAADAGSIESIRYFGNLFTYGGEEQEKDVAEARRWFEAGAERDDANSLFGLARLYHFIEDHPHDHARAAKLYQRAVDQGHSGAMNNLAALYGNGSGVPEDHQQQVALLRRAADIGQAESYVALGNAYRDGKGVQQDAAKALELFAEGAERGLVDGWHNSGVLYWEGIGVTADRKKAIAFFRRAAAQGFNTSLQFLEDNDIAAYDVGLIQRLLADLGFDPGPLDGKMGGKTLTAIRAYHTAKGEPSSGAATLELQKELQTDVQRRGDQSSAPETGQSAPSSTGDVDRNPELDDLEQLD